MVVSMLTNTPICTQNGGGSPTLSNALLDNFGLA